MRTAQNAAAYAPHHRSVPAHEIAERRVVPVIDKLPQEFAAERSAATDGFVVWNGLNIRTSIALRLCLPPCATC